ncbi:MFS general substrate transporter [Periconia macrospinosa]|uniref:MFS general substrate transporter n=1 Tax=Periconia macrospinosa TaxID=97972 RepID=A0A2V1E2F6_9PLEO|nr:MFS general substrate transporter [Periconia macrospinosa]
MAAPHAATDSQKNPNLQQDGPPIIPSEGATTPADTEVPEVPYTVFSHRVKVFIIVMSALSSLFSPVSSLIYLPALDVLSNYYNVSVSRINLSVTTYMILQGLAPMFFGDMADQIGRRPIYIITFIIYVAANIGLALQSNYGALLVLRALQSSGSSGVIALGSAVMADIATPAERSGYISYVQAGMMLGPALAPTIGGLLTQFLGWRAIFWFLTIASGVYLILYIPFAPETCRKVVENGSIPPQDWNRSVWNAFQDRKNKKREGNDQTKEAERQERKRDLAAKRKLAVPNPLKALRIIVEKDVALIMLLTSLMVTGFYMIMVPIPSVFADVYKFNQIQIGLCYLPFSAGSILGTVAAGKFLDWNFRRVAKQIGHPIHLRKGDDLRHFPIEKVRLSIIWIPSVLGGSATLCWGWVLASRTSLAAPLILLFVGGAAIPATMSMQQSLLVDLYPQSPATVTAALNVCRCLMSAAGTSIVQYMIDAMGLGWCYTFVGLVLLASTPLSFIGMKWGPKWREERFLRMEKKAEEK